MIILLLELHIANEFPLNLIKKTGLGHSPGWILYIVLVLIFIKCSRIEIIQKGDGDDSPYKILKYDLMLKHSNKLSIKLMI